ncbi:hypothetical protein Acr_21g0001750 [Actinidia rufa]|uniref:Gamete expressed protein 1 n=1 Tax=Actinidia rufa TaxID=165716 RepID=A0A7J0GFK3_9ERIC|nr:hypothetical protein Acr_21g0001750 [Actinidia rufa]
MGVRNNSFYFLIIVFLVSQTGQSSGFWPFSSGENPTKTPSNAAISGEVAAEFSMESLGNRKGIQLVENAKNKMSTSNSCWQNAYGNLFSGCSEILAGEEKRSRLAWHLSDCFQKDSGRPGFPYCDLKSSMLQCLTKLDEDSRKIYLEFYLETNSICHQLHGGGAGRRWQHVVVDRLRLGLGRSKIERILGYQRGTLQQFAELRSKQEDELLRRQELLQQSHDRLAENSNTILAAQEAFESKQASITKQTYAVRPRLYLGLCATFLIEFAILRDFELENNHMLHKMYGHFMNQFNGSRPREEVLSDTESDMHWSSLVVTELLDDVDKLEDPDYMLPEEIGENSVATTSSTRRYNLRSRCHHP